MQKKFVFFFEITIPLGSITDERLKDLLRCLNARANNVPFGEIVGAYMKKRTRGAHDFLEPQSNFPETGYWCGFDDAQFVAIIVDETGGALDPPALRLGLIQRPRSDFP